MSGLNCEEGQSYTVQFADEFGARNNASSLVLEVDEQVLKGFLDPEQEVEIKGELKDVVSLCVCDKTFKLYTRDSSNTRLFCTLDDEAMQVIASVENSQELKEQDAPVHVVRELLEQHKYSGEEEEAQNEHDGAGGAAKRQAAEPSELYSTERLLREIPYSRADIMQALKLAGAILIDGHWRLLSSTYTSYVLEQVLATLVELDMPFSAVDATAVGEAIDDVPSTITEHVLRNLSHSKNSDGTISVSLEKVCVERAKPLLRSRDRWEAKEFMRRWKAVCPEEAHYTLQTSWLWGHVITQQMGAETHLRSFPSYVLPRDPIKRMHRMFEYQAQWTVEQFTPYILEITMHSAKETDKLMKKHTRRLTTAEGPVVVKR